ncbi:MAG: site-2 protease family protein [Methanomassiliicoccaceae archaeon]|nr:site-2 protease family protein [Methanomassiliicoccaceae archaeon]
MGVIDTLIGNTTYLVLLILLIAYIPLYLYVKANRVEMDKKGIVTYGPFLMLKTKHGVRFLDKFAKYKKFWEFFGILSKIIAAVLMIAMIFIMVMNVIVLPMMMTSPGLGVEYALALPGINPMLPLSYGIIGLIVALVLHEMAHGIQTRANDMNVESVGLLYAVVPVGAFVEPNDEQIRNTSRKARSSMYAAGIAINFVTAVVLFIIMSVGLMGSVSSNFDDRAAVVNVSYNSPAYDSDIPQYSLVVGVGDGVDNWTYDDLMSFEVTPGTEYKVNYTPGKGVVTSVNMRMGIFIEGVVKGHPADVAGISKGAFVVSIDGNDVKNISSFGNIMSTKVDPGDEVEVIVLPYNAGTKTIGAPETYNVTLGENNGRAYLGVTYTFSGFSLTTPGTVLDTVRDPFGNVDSVSDAALAALGYIGGPIRGYSPLPQEMMWWYHSDIMSDGAFWTILQIVYWIFWLNLVLAITNALPAVPFDGGYLMMDGVGKIVDRTHKNASREERERIVGAITRTVSYLMLFILLLVMMAILF